MEFEWVDIGKVPDYWHAIRGVLTGEIKNVQIPGHQVAPGIYTGLNVSVNWDKVDIQGPVYIGGMTHIEDGAKIIGPTMIGPNCWVCSGATVDNSVIFEYSRLGPGVRLVDKLVFGRYCVDKTGATIDVQAAALDWLITDARQELPSNPPAERQAIAELLKTDNGMLSDNNNETLNNV
jgi:mannose-1-phosphate guanylyltransferase